MNYRSSIVLGNILMAILNLMPNPFPYKKKKKHAFYEVIDEKMSSHLQLFFISMLFREFIFYDNKWSKQF